MNAAKRQTLIALLQFLIVRLGDAFLVTIVYLLITPRFGFSYSPFQPFFAYSLFGTVCLLPWALRQGKALYPRRTGLYLLRALFEYTSFCLGFIALRHIELPEHTTLNFVTPLFGTVLAIFILKEKTHAHTWVALVAGFAGVLMVTRPGVIPFNIGVAYVLLAALGFAFCAIFIKWLGETESPQKIAFYMLLLTAIFGAPLASLHWVAPTREGWCWLAGLGIVAYVQQVLVAASIAKVPLITLMPLNFTRLIFVSVLSYLFYHQVIDRWTGLGAVVILAATIYDGVMTTRHAKEIRAENP